MANLQPADQAAKDLVRSAYRTMPQWFDAVEAVDPKNKRGWTWPQVLDALTVNPEPTYKLPLNPPPLVPVPVAVAAATPAAMSPEQYIAANPDYQTDAAKLMVLASLYRAENDRLKSTRSAGPLSLKVSDKGAVSVYGMGRFPVTLYRSQWVRLFAATDQIRKFLADNNSLLRDKPSA